MLFFFITGCDKYTKYKVASFFFTGVPHPDEQMQTSSINTGKPLSPAELAKAKRALKSQDIKFVSHGPYAANQCYQCHDTNTTAGLSNKGKKTTTMPQWSGRMPGRLVAPLKKLCSECHVTKSTESAYNRELWIHGPVSDGMCTLCHNPHQTSNPYMLKKETTIELCTSCHGKGYIIETEEHTSGKECGSCHNAHLGANRFLLKKDFNEIF